ncbi:MAG: MFS transporter [Acidimicrobiia bacterium]|nr:MFS transporter [Acidimicrobiia bacterium]
MVSSRRPPLLFIYAVTITGILSNALVSPAIPDILEDLGVDDSRAGLLVAFSSMPGIFVAPVIGVLADRFGRRAVLVPCLAIFGAFGLVVAAAPTFEVLLAARLVQGVGSAGLINLAVVLIGDHWQGVERTRLVGRNAAMLTVGLAVLPLVSGTLTQFVGWRAAMSIYAVGLVTAVVGWRVLDQSKPEVVDGFREQIRGGATMIRRPVIAATLVSGFFLFVGIFGLFLTNLPVHLEDEFGLEAGWRGAVIASPAVMSTLAAFNLGRIRSRFGLRSILVASGMTFVIAFPLMGLAPSVAVVVLASSIYGLGEGLFIPTLQDVATSAAPTEYRGAVVAIWVSAVRAGQTVGPLLVVGLAGVASSSAIFVWGTVVAVIVLSIQILGPIDDDAMARA